MASLNRTELIGNVGADPEVRFAPNGDVVANVRVATTDVWRDRTSGELRDHTEWHRAVLWGRLGEIARDHIRKGSQIYVAGALKTRRWTDGEGVERFMTEIRVRELQLLGKRADRPTDTPDLPIDEPPAGFKPEDDIPF